MLSNDRLSPVQTDIVTISSFEKSPENIFNFDTQIVEKFTHKEKSILLSDLSQRNSKNILAANVEKNEGSRSKNIIFNKLYDENVFMQSNYESEILCEITFDHEMKEFIRDKNDKMSHLSESPVSSGNFECTNHPNVSTASVDHPTLLFAENKVYDMLPPSENSMNTTPYDQQNQELKAVEFEHRTLNEAYQQLTGGDLLNFAKQIAIGMVSDFIYLLALFLITLKYSVRK